VRTLEFSEFRVARAELLEEDSVILSYVAAILAKRLNSANEALLELKGEIKLHNILGKTIAKAVKKMEELLTGAPVQPTVQPNRVGLLRTPGG
jgi:hypothetical protein